MEEITKKRVLIVVLSSLHLLVILPTLYYSGANSLIVGTYTIIMFIVLSMLTVQMITQQNSRKSTRA